MAQQFISNAQWELIAKEILDDEYSVVSKAAETRTSVALEVSSENDGARHYLWFSKFYVPINHRGDFERRFQDLKELTYSPPLVKCGFSAKGQGYMLQEGVCDSKAKLAHLKSERADELFKEMVKAVAQVHYFKHCLGDLCLESFFVDSDGTFWLSSLIGTIPDRINNVEPDVLHYVSPEQHRAGATTLQSDVFALGVLGFRLITGKFPKELNASNNTGITPSSSDLLPPSHIADSDIPWLDYVLGRCLNYDTKERFDSAVEIIKFIEQVENSGASKVTSSHWALTQDQLGQQQQESASEPSHSPRVEERSSSDNESKRGSSRSYIVFVCMLIGVVSILIGGFVYSKFADKYVAIDSDPFSKLGVVSPQIEVILSDLRQADVPPQKSRELINTLATFNIKAANDAVILIGQGALGVEHMKFASDILLDKVGRLRYANTAEMLVIWKDEVMSKLTNVGSDLSFPAIMRAVNPLYTMEERRNAFRTIFEKDDLFAIPLAAAVVLDEGDNSGLYVLLRELVQLKNPELRIPDVSFAVLVHGMPELSLRFSGSVKLVLKEASDSELAWLANRITHVSPIFRDVLNELLRRDMVSNVRREFLTVLLSSTSEVPGLVSSSLVRLSLREFSVDDLNNIASWQAPQVVDVLVRVCLIENEKYGLLAFEKLSARMQYISKEPFKSLVEWAVKNQWEKRAEIYKDILVFADMTLSTASEITGALERLMARVKSEEFFNIMTKSDDAVVLTLTLDRVGRKAPTTRLLPFLKHPDPSVRIAAIRVLKGVSSFDTKQAIVARYQNERSREVLDAYEAELPFVLPNSKR